MIHLQIWLFSLIWMLELSDAVQAKYFNTWMAQINETKTSFSVATVPLSQSSFEVYTTEKSTTAEEHVLSYNSEYNNNNAQHDALFSNPGL